MNLQPMSDNEKTSNSNEISLPNSSLIAERTFDDVNNHDKLFFTLSPLLFSISNSQFSNIDISNIQKKNDESRYSNISDDNNECNIYIFITIYL